VDFSKRNHEAEIIDTPHLISSSEWSVILRELRIVNRWLGGSRAALREIKPLIQEIAGEKTDKRPVDIVDLGSGSADIPAALVTWARKAGYSLRVLAVDVDPTVCKIARRHTLDVPEISVLQGDVKRSPLKKEGCDLIVCSAFLHHFTHSEIAALLRTLLPKTRKGVVINDLHRHPLAYWGIRLLTALFSRSKAVRNDGPLSVLKGFQRTEVGAILEAAGVGRAQVRWRWAFRYVVFISARPSCHPNLVG
jgi:2-polyprenyl-3-methyl-5-hydroxy-6-metoxy-1,4-benzoquinol methylase